MVPAFKIALHVFLLFVLSISVANAQGNSDQGTFDPEARLKELGIDLPPAPNPVANYVNGVRTGNLIFLAGKGPKEKNRISCSKMLENEGYSMEYVKQLIAEAEANNMV